MQYSDVVWNMCHQAPKLDGFVFSDSFGSGDLLSDPGIGIMEHLEWGEPVVCLEEVGL